MGKGIPFPFLFTNYSLFFLIYKSVNLQIDFTHDIIQTVKRKQDFLDVMASIFLYLLSKELPNWQQGYGNIP